MRTVRSTLWGIYKQISFYNLAKISLPFFDLFIGGKNRPAFFNIDTTRPEFRILEENFEVIKSELEAILPYQHQMPKYHELDTDLIHASGRYNRDKRWNVFMLQSYGTKPEHNRALCPKTVTLIDQIPNVVQAFFSILDGGKSIPAHEAPTRSVLRYHLALRVPQNNPPQLRVVDQLYTWQEGQAMIFDDSLNHEVINHANEVRVILLIDFLRPLPILPHAVNVAWYNFSKQIYGRKIKKSAAGFVVRVGE